MNWERRRFADVGTEWKKRLREAAEKSKNKIEKERKKENLFFPSLSFDVHWKIEVDGENYLSLQDVNRISHSFANTDVGDLKNSFSVQFFFFFVSILKFFFIVVVVVAAAAKNAKFRQRIFRRSSSLQKKFPFLRRSRIEREEAEDWERIICKKRKKDSQLHEWTNERRRPSQLLKANVVMKKSRI